MFPVLIFVRVYNLDLERLRESVWGDELCAMVVRDSVRHSCSLPFVRRLSELEYPPQETFVLCRWVYVHGVLVERTFGERYREEVHAQLNILAIGAKSRPYGEIIVPESQRLQTSNELVLRTVGQALVDVSGAVGCEHAMGTSISPLTEK